MRPWLIFLSNLINRIYTRGGRWLALRFRHYFYLYLAVIVSVFVLVDATHWHKLFDARQSNFDALVKHRVIKPKPDPNIVILDINEASLATLSNDLGRWPWPRAALADVLSKVAEQKPQAIVFDILFSEPDVLNPDSDAAFNTFLQSCNTCYLPWVRLAPEQDRLSELKANQIPGARKLEGADTPIAAILPYFPAGLASGRLGFNSATPDSDGILRQYGAFTDVGSARLLSIPARVVFNQKELPPSLPASFLVNWRGQQFTYPYISFSDLYSDALSEHPKRPKDEFKNKIVIIGSTAPSLFDYRASPVADQFPGVEIIATTLDNLKNDDYFRIPPLRWAYILLALTLVWATAWSFYRHASPEKLMRWFGFSQIVLVLISYISINLSHYYINLVGPVSFSIAYFSFAKLYAFATRRTLENSAWMASRDPEPGTIAQLAWIQIVDEQQEPISEALLQKLKQSLPAQWQDNCHVLSALQNGAWRMLEGGLMLTILHKQDEAAVLNSEAIRQQINDWLKNSHLQHYHIARCSVAEQTISNPDQHASAWQTLFAQALIAAVQPLTKDEQ